MDAPVHRLGGHRFTCFATDSKGGQLADLELRHQLRARCKDRIRAAKDTGLRKFPFQEFKANQAWLEVVLGACDLIAWTQRLCLTGDLAKAEPRRLRYTLFHTPGRLARHARRTVLRLAANWPWNHHLRLAFVRLRKIPRLA